MRIPIIAVDFDGTLCVHQYPAIGDELPGAFTTLKFLRENGCKLFLWSMRCGDRLIEAAAWCRTHGFVFDEYNKSASGWNPSSPKAYAHLYIDDAALGCPLRKIPGERDVVDWTQVAANLEHKGLINQKQLNIILNEINANQRSVSE